VTGPAFSDGKLDHRVLQKQSSTFFPMRPPLFFLKLSVLFCPQ